MGERRANAKIGRRHFISYVQVEANRTPHANHIRVPVTGWILSDLPCLKGLFAGACRLQIAAEQRYAQMGTRMFVHGELLPTRINAERCKPMTIGCAATEMMSGLQPLDRGLMGLPHDRKRLGNSNHLV